MLERSGARDFSARAAFAWAVTWAQAWYCLSMSRKTPFRSLIDLFYSISGGATTTLEPRPGRQTCWAGRSRAR